MDAGKVLLETIMAPGTPLTTVLSTNATLVDLTNLYYDSPASQYTAVTYKGVDQEGGGVRILRTLHAGDEHAGAAGAVLL